MQKESIIFPIYCLIGILILVVIVKLFPYILQKQIDPQTLEIVERFDQLHKKNETFNDYMKDINQSLTDQLEKEFNLLFTVDESYPGELIFHANRPATVVEARALVVSVVNKYMDVFNAHDKIRSYLQDTPIFKDGCIKPEHLQFSIKFYVKDGICTDGCIALVHKTYHGAPKGLENKIIYTVEDPFTYEQKAIYEETYEEAIQMNAANSIANPAVHSPTEQEAIHVQPQTTI